MSYSNQVFKNTETGQLYDIFTQPTTDLIPAVDITYDLGSITKRWDQAYIYTINASNDILLDGASINQSTSITATFTGPFSSSVPITLTKLFNKMVQISLGPIPSSSVSSASIATASGVVPLFFRPTSQCSFTCALNMSGNKLVGKITILPTGDITMEIQQQTTSTPQYVGFGAFQVNMALISSDRIQGFYLQ
jgi:hypothetical protein